MSPARLSISVTTLKSNNNGKLSCSSLIESKSFLSNFHQKSKHSRFLDHVSKSFQMKQNREHLPLPLNKIHTNDSAGASQGKPDPDNELSPKSIQKTESLIVPGMDSMCSSSAQSQQSRSKLSRKISHQMTFGLDEDLDKTDD
jgi:hypothetical protein